MLHKRPAISLRDALDAAVNGRTRYRVCGGDCAWCRGRERHRQCCMHEMRLAALTMLGNAMVHVVINVIGN
jgi:hypothetical protein